MGQAGTEQAVVKVGRGPGRRYQKGQPSANPGGRPKGLMARIRALTHDGADLADWVYGVWRGTEKFEVATKTGVVLTVAASPDLRMEAVDWLASYGFGKPAPMIVDDDGVVRAPFIVAFLNRPHDPLADPERVLDVPALPPKTAA